MADYNIYIHAVDTSGNANPTTPWSQREGSGGAAQTTQQGSGSIGGSGADALTTVSRAAGFMQNPDSIVSSGIGSISSALPWVAAAYAVVKIATIITDNVLEFQALESGYYKNQNLLQDLKTGLNNVLHPFSSSFQSWKTRNEWRRENNKLKVERDLLGDSVINSYTGRGV